MSFARAFSALTGASAITLAVQLVRGKLMALLLGPVGVGIFNQLGLLFNLATLAGQLGSFNGIVQHGAAALDARDDVALRRLTGTATLLLGALSCLIALSGVVLSQSLSDLLLHDGGDHADLVALILLAVPLAVTAQIYRALLSSARDVKALVRAQVFSDLGALAVFVALIFPYGLTGAVIGFMSTHLLLFLGTAEGVRRRLGLRLLIARPRDFRWSVVRSNVEFGASSLVMVAAGNLSILAVSTLVIDQLGAAANGIFANAWRIASIYLGAVTAATISYYLPTLTRARDASEMGRISNDTLRTFLLLLPPLMAAIMAGGELLVWLILSRESLLVAPLLLLFVPAELLRILGETISVALLARRRLRLLMGCYLVQAGTFVVAAWLLLPGYGLAGTALAYGLSTALSTVVFGFAAWRQFNIAPDRATLLSLARALLLLAGVAAATYTLEFGPLRLAIAVALLLCWLVLTWTDQVSGVLLKTFAGRWALKRQQD